jgi:hypothetical protein
LVVVVVWSLGFEPWYQWRRLPQISFFYSFFGKEQLETVLGRWDLNQALIGAVTHAFPFLSIALQPYCGVTHKQAATKTT